MTSNLRRAIVLRAIGERICRTVERCSEEVGAKKLTHDVINPLSYEADRVCDPLLSAKTATSQSALFRTSSITPKVLLVVKNSYFGNYGDHLTCLN